MTFSKAFVTTALPTWTIYRLATIKKKKEKKTKEEKGVPREAICNMNVLILCGDQPEVSVWKEKKGTNRTVESTSRVD